MAFAWTIPRFIFTTATYRKIEEKNIRLITVLKMYPNQ